MLLRLPSQAKGRLPLKSVSHLRAVLKSRRQPQAQESDMHTKTVSVALGRNVHHLAMGHKTCPEAEVKSVCWEGALKKQDLTL